MLRLHAPSYYPRTSHRIFCFLGSSTFLVPLCHQIGMARKCSSCGNNGHNSRTCSGHRGMETFGGGGGGGLRLFGVQLHVGTSPLKKSFSMECLPSSSGYYAAAVAASNSSSSVSSSSSLVSVEETAEKMGNGYLSDGLMRRAAQERKKGVPWTEDEHRRFLAGLEKLGKGDWRGISRHFVATRTPTQVASHAQKYFLRQGGLAQKKRRSSLFDVVENGEKAASGLRLKDEAASSVSAMGFPAMSLGGTTTTRPRRPDAVLPPCLPLMPNCSPSPTASHAPKLPPLIANHRAPPRQQTPDLDLKISTSAGRQTDQAGSSPSPRTPFFGTISVT